MTDYGIGQQVSAFYDGVPVKCVIAEIVTDNYCTVRDANGYEWTSYAVNIFDREDTDAESIARIDEWITRCCHD